MNTNNGNEIFCDVKEAAKRLGYRSTNSITNLIKNMELPNAFKSSGKWRIPFNDLETFKKQSINCLDTTALSVRLGKSKSTILTLIKQMRFPNAFETNRKWWIPISDVEEYLKSIDTDKCLGINEVAQMLGYKSKNPVLKAINRKCFPNAFITAKKWWIPINDIEEYQNSLNTDNCLDITEAAQMLGYKETSSVQKAIYMKCFPNAFKSAKKWWIPINDINTYLHKKTKRIDDANKKKRITKERRTSNKALINNCLDIRQATQRLNEQSSLSIKKLIAQKHFPNAFKASGKWWIPVKDIESYEETNKQFSSQYINTIQAALRLGYSNSTIVANMITRGDKFPNSIKIDSCWYIPLKDIEEFESLQEQSKKKINYSGKVGFEELKEFIESLDQKQGMQETKQFFLDYCLLQTNNMTGTPSYIRGRIGEFKLFYERLYSSINKEIYLLSIEEINYLIYESSLFSKAHKKLFVKFSKYTYNRKNIKPTEEIVISTINQQSAKSADKEVYPPDLFYKIYEYVKDIKTHTPFAIKDRYYANMWTYTTLLLTDFIRGNDLVLNTPNINLENLNINTLDWFLENQLSEVQAQSVINQIYIHFRHKRASKNKELLTFIVSPDLIRPLATSLVISELHRKVDKAEMILDTFIAGRYSTIKTEGTQRHKHFFKSSSDFKEFRFGSQKMNNSVGTYLFYSITEEDGYDGELALYFTQIARSHKSPESTSIYIQATNKDGPINRVSYNLFRRGHFGWLYNYLILYASQNNVINSSLEDRTKLIENMRSEISPSTIENLSQYINIHLNLIPYNDSKNMEEHLINIYKKRQSVISKLINYSDDDIKEIIKMLAQGKMPSKNEHAQCLQYPNCKYPKLVHCYSCEYVIPQNLLLIQLKEEINRLILNLNSHINEILIMKDSRFLLHALLIWKEARLSFGEETVNAFIPTEETWEKIKEIAYKLPIK